VEKIDVPEDALLSTRVPLSTRWSDEDNQSVLNNAVYSTLLEEARLHYFRALGLMLPDGSFPFVLAQCHLRFASPGRGGAAIEARMATVHLGRSSFEQAYRLRDAATGRVLVEARALLVAWDGASRTKRDMAPEFRAAIARHEGLEREPGSAAGP
jgi:acyl-CoA thioester hydrolase